MTHQVGASLPGQGSSEPRAVFWRGAHVPAPTVLRGTRQELSVIQAGGPGTAVPPAWAPSGSLQGDTKGSPWVYPTWLSLLRPGTLGAAQQAGRAMLTSWQGHPPEMLLPEVHDSRPHRLSPCPCGTGAHLGPDPEHRRACPHVGVMGTQPPVGPAGGGQGGRFPSAPRCHRAGVAAGAWHGPKSLGGWLCGMATMPSPLLGLTPRQPGRADLAGGSWP